MLSDLVSISILIGSTIGYVTGTLVEKRHYKSLAKEEDKLSNTPVITASWKRAIRDSEEVKLFAGSVVIGADLFKTTLAALINIVGGRVTVYESLLDRGSREAIIRMKQKAKHWGADKIVNLRIVTSRIGFIPCAEIIAYGTALKNKNALPK